MTTVAGGAANGIIMLLSISVAGLVYPSSLGALQARGVGLILLGSALLALVTAISYLSGLAISIRQELDMDRELRAAGLGNLAGGLFGGVVGFHLISLSVLMRRMGVRQRAGGVLAAAVVALPLLFDAAALNVLPRFVLSGLLIYFGIILSSARSASTSASRASPMCSATTPAWSTA